MGEEALGGAPSAKRLLTARSCMYLLLGRGQPLAPPNTYHSCTPAAGRCGGCALLRGAVSGGDCAGGAGGARQHGCRCDALGSRCNALGSRCNARGVSLSLNAASVCVWAARCTLPRAIAAGGGCVGEGGSSSVAGAGVGRGGSDKAEARCLAVRAVARPLHVGYAGVCFIVRRSVAPAVRCHLSAGSLCFEPHGPWPRGPVTSCW